MSNNRRKYIKRAGYDDFVPDENPPFIYLGKKLRCEHEKRCYKDGWDKAERDHIVVETMVYDDYTE